MANPYFRFAAATALAGIFPLVAMPAVAAPLPSAGSATSVYLPASTNWSPEDDVANGWYRGHRRGGISAGDVFAGVLVLGGIAAIASAANKSSRDTQYRDDYRYREDTRYREDYRYDDRNRDTYNYRDTRPDANSGGYQASGIDNAVNMCVGQVERGDTRVASVDNASRTGDGWRISGQLEQGSGFNCWIDNDGRIRDVNLGDSYSANDVPNGDHQWNDNAYARAREKAQASASYDNYDNEAPVDGDLTLAGS